MNLLLDKLCNLFITFVNQHMSFQRVDHTINVWPQQHQYVIQVHLTWKMIVTHMYLPSMWDEGKSKSVYSVLNDFDSFEEWYRSELWGRIVHTLMEVNIQSLHVKLQDTDMHDEKVVLDTMVLSRLLDGNMRAQVEHHNTR